jgi:hypothetical protein
MSDFSTNAPLREADRKSKWVWFDEIVALKKGQGVCFYWDYSLAVATPAHAIETAASVDYQRTTRVKLPTILNAPYFAGVAASDYAASPTGQLIEINIPGSTCQILTKKNLTIGVGRVTCQAGGTLAGYFTNEGFQGQGSAVPLQTLDTSTTPAKTLALLEEGPQSGLQETLAASTAGGAVTLMATGVTHFPTETISANITNTPAAGTRNGQKKRFVIDGTQTTSSVVITYGGTAMKYDNSTTMASLTMATAGCDSTVEWVGYWHLVANLTSTVG